MDYSRENRKRISRPALQRIRQQLLRTLLADPPEIGIYPRAIDVELFRLFWSNPVSQVEKSAVTLGRYEARREREVWVYETKGVETDSQSGVMRSEYVEFGQVQEDGSFLPIPMLTELPAYSSNTEDALLLKSSLLSDQMRVTIEEVMPEADLPPLWRARILDAFGKIVSEGETFYIAASIVLAIVSGLIADEEFSWWVAAVDAYSER